MDPMVTALEITPATIVASIVDGRVETRALRVYATDAEGSRDVTNQVTWSLADTRFGKFHDNRLTVMGGGAGPTDIIATFPDGRTVRASLTVYVKGTRNLGAPDDAAGWFTDAAVTPGCGPAIAYPEDHTLVPANLGELDVHWTDLKNDLFRVHVTNPYVDLTYLTTSGWMTVDADWSLFATSRAPIVVDVASMQASTPTVKCVTKPRHVEITRDVARGAVYYWSTDWEARAQGGTGQSILRYDLATPGIAPAPMPADASARTGCVGCHALSRDGRRIAMTLDGTDGVGAVLDLATNQPLMSRKTDAPRWSTAAFTADGEKLVTVEAGQLWLRSATTGEELAFAPSSQGTIAANPEVSPDGTRLVNVESTPGDDGAPDRASIVVRRFDDRTNTFGEPRIVLPFDPKADTQSYYPSWSPDGRWLAITRAPRGSSFANPEATIWVLDADGRSPPIEITAGHGVMDSWARWLPAANHVGEEPVYFLTFSSIRPFGTRIPEGGMSQIWVAPFYPERAVDGRDATGPAYRAPFQKLYASNHNAQWTAAVVTAP